MYYLYDWNEIFTNNCNNKPHCFDEFFLKTFVKITLFSFYVWFSWGLRKKKKMFFKSINIQFSILEQFLCMQVWKLMQRELMWLNLHNCKAVWQKVIYLQAKDAFVAFWFLNFFFCLIPKKSGRKLWLPWFPAKS